MSAHDPDANPTVANASGLIDVSMTLRPGMLVYPGDPPCSVRPCTALVEGDPTTYRTSHLTLTTHTGTHIDPPSHFIPDGDSVDAIPLETLIGPARVLDLRGEGLHITAEVLAKTDLEGAERVLLKTDNGALLEQPFTPDYAALTPCGARHLLARCPNLRMVGIDYLSIEHSEAADFPVHHLLLGAGVIIVEGLDLRQAPAGDHVVWCLPLKIKGGDGGPARVVLAPHTTDHAGRS